MIYLRVVQVVRPPGFVLNSCAERRPCRCLMWEMTLCNVLAEGRAVRSTEQSIYKSVVLQGGCKSVSSGPRWLGACAVDIIELKIDFIGCICESVCT